MKKLFTLLLFLVLYVSTYSQVFVAGLNGSYNATWLFNKSNDNPSMSREAVLSFGSSIGLDLMFYSNSNSYYNNTFFAVAFNPSYRTLKQKYKGTIDVADSSGTKSYPYTSEYNLSCIELPLMLHVQGEAGLYAELGISLGLIQGAKASFSSDDTLFTSFSDADVKSSFASSNISGIFGFGINSAISDQLVITTGFRFTYGLADLNSSEAKSAGVNPTRTGSGGFVLGLAYKFDSYHSRH